MQNELDVVRDISEKLEERGIPFKLTGSLAMNDYATPRMIRAIDRVLELEPDDVAGLVDCLEPEYYVSSTRVWQAASSRTMFIVIHQESVIKVDCIIRKDTDYRRVEFNCTDGFSGCSSTWTGSADRRKRWPLKRSWSKRRSSARSAARSRRTI